MHSSDKIVSDEKKLVEKLQEWKHNAKKIVFTNGCFDILHLGHIDYLEKARALGDKLVVAINTDTSVKKLKGPERPINNEYSRARLLAAMEFIDMVIFFEEDTPYNLIKKVMPDILVKGNDYDLSNIVGADIVMGNGGKVLTINLVDGYSTTRIISKIKQS